MLARLSVRLTRAERTPGCAPRPDSILEMQAAQWIVGSDSAMRASGGGRAAWAAAAGAAAQAGQAEGVGRVTVVMAIACAGRRAAERACPRRSRPSCGC